MSALTLLLGLCAVLVPTALGVGVTLLLKRFIGGWAYMVGWLLPLIALFALYLAYALWMRATPCEPAGSLACGELVAYVLIIFVSVLGLTAVVNTIAQVAMFLFSRARRDARP